MMMKKKKKKKKERERKKMKMKSFGESKALERGKREERTLRREIPRIQISVGWNSTIGSTRLRRLRVLSLAHLRKSRSESRSDSKRKLRRDEKKGEVLKRR